MCLGAFDGLDQCSRGAGHSRQMAQEIRATRSALRMARASPSYAGQHGTLRDNAAIFDCWNKAHRRIDETKGELRTFSPAMVLLCAATALPRLRSFRDRQRAGDVAGAAQIPL